MVNDRTGHTARLWARDVTSQAGHVTSGAVSSSHDGATSEMTGHATLHMTT